MPKRLTEEMLKEVQYVSMSDYMNRMDALDNLEDKMAFTTRYLLSYGVNQNRDVPFEEAVHYAKMKIVDASVALRKKKMIVMPDESVDPFLSDEQDEPNRLFMIEPLEYLRQETNRLIEQEAARDGVSTPSQQRIASYQVMSAVFSSDLDRSIANRISEYEIEPSRRDFMARLKAKFGGEKGLEKAYDKTKPGILSKAFGTSSTAYHNLDEAYRAFNNPNHVHYGDMKCLDKAAIEYLQHALPSWSPRNGFPSQEALNALKGTKKERALFSVNILKATYEQRQGEKVYETIVNANLQRRAEIEAGVDPEESFRKSLGEELAKEDDYDQAQAEKDYADVFKDAPEEEAPNLD